MQAQRDLVQARHRLVGRLLQAAGPDLTAETAQSLLEQAKGWSPGPARELDQHLADHPDAFTAPSPHCPASLVRLLRQMEAAGHGALVTQPAYVMCGRTDRKIPRITPDGRACDWCVNRTEHRSCARCQKVDRMARRTPEGSICDRCYRRDPELSWKECAGCGDHRPANIRREDGTYLCPKCAPRPKHACAGCGNLREVHAKTDDGPLCRSCYAPPPRLCGVCGQVRPIQARAGDGRPDTCSDCYRTPIGECTVCGRHRHGVHVGGRGGAFHCRSCQPRPSRPCADCGNEKRTQVTWPVGPLCDTCYHRRKRNPAPCSRCDTTRVLVGQGPEGGLCGPCCGTEHDYACRRCGFPGNLYADGECARCIAGDRVRDLLSRDDGTIAPQLQPLADGLASAQYPGSVLSWLRSSSGPGILASLATGQIEITHEALDALPQDKTTDYIREILVTTGVLPHRQVGLARLQNWLTSELKRLPPHQAPIIRPFAEWGIVRDARRRAARGRYTSGASTADRMDIRVAIEFLTWLDKNDLDLAAVGQEDLDLWLTTHPTRHRGIGAFIRWAVARRLTGKLTVPPRGTSLPSQFLTEDELHEQLTRCLNDDLLPREVRIIGALVRLYALPISRLVRLTTDRFHRDKDDVGYFTFDRNPVLLPPKLAQLIEDQILQPRPTSMFKQPLTDGAPLLLPGRPPSRPRSEAAVHRLMRQHGLPVLSARNTAMTEAVTDLPPIVVSDLFGVSPASAHRWDRFMQDSWADYLAACQETE